MMYRLIRTAARDTDAAWELACKKKKADEVVDAASELTRAEAMSLGMNFKKFPIGCDLTEILVGTCTSGIEKKDLFGNCRLSDSIGASIHVCAYAFADIAEANGMKGIDLYKEVREITEVPLDLDHFGMYGPMRLPKEITRCPGQCYMEGPPFRGCPRNRIHSRLLDKESEAVADKEEWVKISSSVAVNLTCVQGADGHAAPLKEAEDVVSLAKKYGKGVEAILFIGDGYDDLISGFAAGLNMGVDVFVLEGGPFNRAEERLDAFARAVAIARILAPGKLVVTNGAYEDECRVGLRSGLNGIITGFPKNHHGYMCGYSPGTARRGQFGLPRVIQIMKEEVVEKWTRAPLEKRELEALAKAVKVVGPEDVYPHTVGYTTLGDAHWACLSSTPLYRRVTVEKTANDIARMANEGLIGDNVALLGGRFVSWALTRALDGRVDEITISDADPWVEKVTADNLAPVFRGSIHQAHSDDDAAHKNSDTTIICSTIPEIAQKISRKFDTAIALI